MTFSPAEWTIAVVLFGFPQMTIKQLQHIQNSTVKILTKTITTEEMTPIV